jgi:hypothetical protein
MAMIAVGIYRVVMTAKGTNDPARRSDRDLEKFEKQPDDRKELERLKDLAEKSTGPERVKLDEEIRARSGTAD